MPEAIDFRMIRERFLAFHGAAIAPGFDTYVRHCPTEKRGAALGYRRADSERLNLECYLDVPVEQVVSVAFGSRIARHDIIEIGNFASENAFAMVQLWGAVANDLCSGSEIAVATLTSPLRRMFSRIGVELIELAPARSERIAAAADWGRYYDSDPIVCAGFVAQGQKAVGAFLSRRNRSHAA